MVLGLITNNDREEVRDVTVWCQDNNLSLDMSKIKRLIVDNRKRRVRARPHSHRQGCGGAG
jgi:hypothetical protein